MRRRLLFATITIALLAAVAVFAQNWYELYDDAIKDIDAGRWAQAEKKLLQAKKTSGVASGDRVRRYSNIFEHFFPEFFLGIVYLETNRPEQAQAQFKLARAAKIESARDARFKQIAEFEKRAQTMLIARATPVTPPPGPPPPVKPPPTPTSVPVPAVPADPLEGVRRQFAGTMNDARAQFSQRNFGRADQLGRSARSLADQNKMLPQRDEADAFIGQVAGAASAPLAEALKRRDGANARREFDALVAVLPGAAETFRTRVEALEGEIRTTDLNTRVRGLQRDAMIAFHGGRYAQTLDLLDRAEKLTTLNARGYFYRACSQAALALTLPAGNTAKAKQLQDDARRSYQAAARSAGEFRSDLQWVSPGIKQVFGLK